MCLLPSCECVCVTVAYPECKYEEERGTYEENLSVIYQCAEDFLDVWCGLFAY